MIQVKEPTFDIFSGASDKDALWVEAVQGLARARERMEEIAAEKPGQYFLFSTASHAILGRIETFNKAASAQNTSAAKGAFRRIDIEGR